MKVFIKKLSLTLAVISLVASVFSFAIPNIALAADCDLVGNNPNSNFLNFPTWYRGLVGEERPTSDGTVCEYHGSVANLVFTVALNIIDIVLRLGSIIAVGFVIFGGFKYITAQGDPGKAKEGRQTIMRALLGMLIAIVSSVAVSFVVSRMNNNIKQSGTELLQNTLSLVYFVLGLVAVVMIIIGAYKYIMSSGDPKKAADGKNTIIFSVVGLVIVLLAFTITNFVVGAV
ncbi:MAG: pilin [Candidatus Nomurabacteria bacterium]|jgi:hypothetical protein|nr:pilin [Candidatus Nomurabacteria bacterium]